MTDVEPVVTDFAASGRAGRRNALPDILGSPAGAGTSDLPHKLAELSAISTHRFSVQQPGERYWELNSSSSEEEQTQLHCWAAWKPITSAIN
uniref:cAMP-dependent protein kinase inhibitor beta n=1 Tax=Buteo japonicus TaxID=224669 RepID=A0A8B9ZDE0_9AVES